MTNMELRSVNTKNTLHTSFVSWVYALGRHPRCWVPFTYFTGMTSVYWPDKQTDNDENITCAVGRDKHDNIWVINLCMFIVFIVQNSECGRQQTSVASKARFHDWEKYSRVKL